MDWFLHNRDLCHERVKFLLRRSQENMFLGKVSYVCNSFFNFFLAAPRPTLGHCRGDSLTHPMLITAFYLVQPVGHREPRGKVGALSPAERLAAFELGTFRFQMQHLYLLDHSPLNFSVSANAYSTSVR